MAQHAGLPARTASRGVLCAVPLEANNTMLKLKGNSNMESQSLWERHYSSEVALHRSNSNMEGAIDSIQLRHGGIYIQNHLSNRMAQHAGLPTRTASRDKLCAVPLKLEPSVSSCQGQHLTEGPTLPWGGDGHHGLTNGATQQESLYGGKAVK